MGNTHEALKLITNELSDIDQAISFCKEYHDLDLWERLIDHALNKPEFIVALLQNIGTHIDPLLLVKRIQLNLMIPGLRDALVKILTDYNLQVNHTHTGPHIKNWIFT